MGGPIPWNECERVRRHVGQLKDFSKIRTLSKAQYKSDTLFAAQDHRIHARIRRALVGRREP